MLNEQSFKNPSDLYRPLRIVHRFETVTSSDKNIRMEAVEKRLVKLKSLGFGGIVSTCRVKDSKLITPAGEGFGALIIPPVKAMEPDFLDKLMEAADQGVKIIIMGEGMPCWKRM